MNSPAAAGQIEREVSVGLEQPQPADPLARDAGGGRERHGAVGELDPGVGEVEVRAQERQPRRAHLGRLGAAGEVQHQIEVVDHEVEHHRHVGAPRLERRQALALDVARSVQVGLRGAERAVVALDVAHLELQPAARGRGDAGRRPRRRVAASGFSISTGTPRLEGPEHRRPHGPAWERPRSRPRPRLSIASRSAKARRAELGGHRARPLGDRCRKCRPAAPPRAAARWRAWCRPSAPTPTTPTGSGALMPARPARRTRRTRGSARPRANGGRSLRARSSACERLSSELKKSR